MFFEYVPLVIFLPFLFVLGTAVGSFLNVLIDRLPNEESIMGRSHCDHCKKKLAWHELFPLFSYLFLKGQCRNCKKKISFVMFCVELFTGVVFSILGYYYHSNFPLLLLFLVLASCLIVIFFADMKYHIIPDSMQLVLLLSAVGLIIVHQSSPLIIIRSFPIILLSGFMVMAPILLIYLITRGKGMGFGDVKLAFVMGVLLGPKGGFAALYIGFVLGAVVGTLLLLMKKKKLKQMIAFGPFLVLGIVAVLIYGREINQLIYHFYGI